MLFFDSFTDRLSYTAGDTVRLFVSTNVPRYRLEIHRLGAMFEQVYPQNDESSVVEGATQGPGNASRGGYCEWESVTGIAVKDEWKTGYYRIRLAGGDTTVNQSDTFFVVRATRSKRKILLQLATNTYYAYNRHRPNNVDAIDLYFPTYPNPPGREYLGVSFLRPLIFSHNASFYKWELPFIRWAEENDYELDYAVNVDLERATALQGYCLLVSVGHDEYWSKRMRENVQGFVAAGGNVAFFSGNVCCWQVRFENPEHKHDERFLLSCKTHFRKDHLYDVDNQRLTALWSSPLVGQPENTLTGVGMQYGGYSPHRMAPECAPPTLGEEFRVWQPGHWVFDGTHGVERFGIAKCERPEHEDQFGSMCRVVGYECDGCEYEVANGLPRPTGRDGTPKNFEILALAAAGWGTDWGSLQEDADPCRVGSATLGIVSNERGGFVFTAGTTDWVRGLSCQRRPVNAVEQITRNVLDRLGDRSLRRRLARVVRWLKRLVGCATSVSKKRVKATTVPPAPSAGREGGGRAGT
jgi:N,N-dimethylformamidase beta subunit-like protein